MVRAGKNQEKWGKMAGPEAPNIHYCPLCGCIPASTVGELQLGFGIPLYFSDLVDVVGVHSVRSQVRVISTQFVVRRESDPRENTGSLFQLYPPLWFRGWTGAQRHYTPPTFSKKALVVADGFFINLGLVPKWAGTISWISSQIPGARCR